jgi:hypothetical protein
MNRKDYIKSKQQGGILDMKELRKRLNNPGMSKDATNVAKQSKLAPIVASKDMFGRVVPTPTNQGEISATPVKSLREKITSTMNYLDRDGKNGVAGIVTEPIKAGMRLLRPDKYFSGVNSDADIPAALGRLGMDAAMVAPMAKGFTMADKFATELGAVEGGFNPGIKTLGKSISNESNLVSKEAPAGLFTDDYHGPSKVTPSKLYEFMKSKDQLALADYLQPKKIIGHIGINDLDHGLDYDIDDLFGHVGDEPMPGEEWGPSDEEKLIKDSFIKNVRATHDIPEQELSSILTRVRRDTPNMNPKDIGFMVKNNYLDRVRSDFAPKGLAGGETDLDFIREHNLRTDYTPQEKLLASQYTRGYDNTINLRGNTARYSGDMVDAISKTRSNLEALITSNKIKNPTTVYRGESTYTIPKVIDAQGNVKTNVLSRDLEVGDTYEPRSFISTSILKNKAFGGDVTHEIMLPGGNKQSILYPNAMGRSEFPYEYEGVLPSKLKLRVDAVDADIHTDMNGQPYRNKVNYRTSIVNPYSLTGLGLLGTGLLGLQKK